MSAEQTIFQGATMSERTKKIVVIAVIGFLALSIVRGITGRFSHNTDQQAEPCRDRPCVGPDWMRSTG